MKTTLIATAALLAVGFGTSASGQMTGKCNGNGMRQGGTMNQQGRMMMNGDMQHDKAIMMQHLDAVRTCVGNAKTTQELNACNMRMRKGGPMMPNQPKMQKGGGPMMQNGDNMPMNRGDQ